MILKKNFRYLKKLGAVLSPLAMLVCALLLGRQFFIAQAKAEKSPADHVPNITRDVCTTGGCTYTSIQDAIDAAVDGDIVDLGGEVFTESIMVDKSVTIQGAGDGHSIIQAAGTPGTAAARVITIASGITVTIDSVSIRYGNASGSGDASLGGGIFNQGTLTLTNSTIYSNTASFYGGGIYSDGYARTVVLYIENCEVISNTAYDGGGIFNYTYHPSGEAYLSIKSSRVSHNTAAHGGGIHNEAYSGNSWVSVFDSDIVENNVSVSGGGIYNVATEANAHASVDIIRTNILNNISSYEGGGISNYANDHASADLLITQSNVNFNSARIGAGFNNAGVNVGIANLSIRYSTIYSNTATGTSGSGGGIQNTGATSSTVTTIIESSTVSSNYAYRGGGVNNNGSDTITATLTVSQSTFSGNWAGVFNYGGGIRNYKGILNLFGNILANSPVGQDCYDFSGTVNDLGYNLVEDGDYCGFDLMDDPALGPIEDNGGSTWTHALQTESPAFDAIPRGDCVATVDQRGVPRPLGSGCEMGSFEVESISLEIEKSVDDASPEVGQTITFTVVLSNSGRVLDNILIQDPLPAGLNFIGPISLDPMRGIIGSQPPDLAIVSLLPGEQVTVTFPVSVSYGLPADTQIVNAVSATQPSVELAESDSITLTVTNSAPVAADDGGVGFISAEDTPFITGNVLANDGDPNGDSLSVLSMDTTSTQGVVNNNEDGTFSYNPDGQFDDLAAGELATDIFTYTISDGHGGSDIATVTITITGKDKVPDWYFIFLPLVVR